MKIVSFFKAIIICLFIALTLPSVSNAMNVKPAVVTPIDSAQDAKVLSRLLLRVTEIQNMDKSDLTPSDKKALRKELKEMKKTADGLNSRVYLSVGAIIIIILVLILLLR